MEVIQIDSDCEDRTDVGCHIIADGLSLHDTHGSYIVGRSRSTMRFVECHGLAASASFQALWGGGCSCKAILISASGATEALDPPDALSQLRHLEAANPPPNKGGFRFIGNQSRAVSFSPKQH